MSKIAASPYVNFQGRAREAMEFFHKVVGGKLDLHSAIDKGGAQTGWFRRQNHTCELEAEGIVVIADGHPDYPASVGNNMAVALGGTDEERLTGIFNELAEGGRILMPVTRQPWGGSVGWMLDRFGVPWTVTIDAK